MWGQSHSPAERLGQPFAPHSDDQRTLCSAANTANMAFIPEDKGFLGRLTDRVSSVFQKPIDPKEAVRNWTNQIRSENRRTDRSIRGALA